MKIGFVRRGFSPTGGAESYLRRLVDGVTAAGHDWVLFGGREWADARWLAPSQWIPVPGSTPRRFADALASMNPREHCDFLFSLERVWKCDAYRAGDGVHRAWLARRACMEASWRSRLREWNTKHRQILTLERALFAPEGAGIVVANSRLVREEILTHYPAYRASRIEVIFNGLPQGEFHPVNDERRSRARAALGLPADAFIILFAGSGWERKGLGHALAALGRLPSAIRPMLVVAGRGRPAAFLGKCARQTVDRTRFLGAVREMSHPYAAADVFVLPTLYDPFSNACLEALASGLPVVTSDANGFAEVLTPGENGDVVPVRDAGDGGIELAACLEGWANPARRHAARIACTDRASEFSMARNVALTLSRLGIS